MNPTVSSKEALRQTLRQKRQEIPPEQYAARSREITTSLLKTLKPFETILVYSSKPPEVDTRPLIRSLLNEGKNIIVPIIQREDCSLRLSYIRTADVLVPSTFNVPEPIGNEIPADPADIDVALIPLLGFDDAGNRIGYGAGYYDRFLSKHTQFPTVGVAFAVQRCVQIPHEATDQTLDAVVTEAGITIISKTKFGK
ncbi:5-formyltetrahydrofolate cyclo-ligase [Methanogenium organophilum]|uniref:5-formyltetrahydrofolate cyclo-ligase n=1 Tax=Methanogenium organophilum TaxID=2199 RepID=A0A9X9S4S4_METOG|nr:5-formyltetrahydrofolate cyclo-ligase [Methanogenium organophilum]WAI01521.1 5-formyltetrahydrofolate cyclo-ligase [Methanogenium organophilum]